MKFSVLVAIVDENIEEIARDTAKEAGASGVTVLSGIGSGAEEKKVFFGLTIEGAQKVLLYVLEKHLSLKVLKALNSKVLKEKDAGVAFTLPIEHIAGIDMKQIEQFSAKIRSQI